MHLHATNESATSERNVFNWVVRGPYWNIQRSRWCEPLTLLVLSTETAKPKNVGTQIPQKRKNKIPVNMDLSRKRNYLKNDPNIQDSTG